MRWLARNSRGTAIVEAKNWLWAVAKAQEPLELPQDAFTSMFAVRRDDGGLNVSLHMPEPVHLFPLRDDESEQAALASTAEDKNYIELVDVPDEVTAAASRWLGKLTRQVDHLAAAEMALDAAADVIGAESLSIIEHKADGLHFVAARGPYSEGMESFIIDEGRGIAGFVFATGHGVMFNDVTASTTHLHAIDDQTGYRPTAILAVPIGDEAGYHGVIELLNSEVDFQSWQIGVLRMIGAALARAWRDAP